MPKGKLNFLKQRLPLAVTIVGGLAFVAGIIVLIAAGRETVNYRVHLFRIAGILFFAMTGLSAYYLWLSREEDPNYFLYDKEKRRNLPIESLTFEALNKRMNDYLASIVEDEMDLWQGRVLTDDNSFGEGAVFRPLVAYKMLYDLILTNDEEHWLLFEEASAPTIRLLCRTIERAGDKDMADALSDVYKRENVDTTENIRDLLRNNQKYLRERMLRYVTANIELFY